MDAVAEWGQIITNADELTAHLASLQGAGAPASMRDMAKQAGWEWLYALYRFCSVAIHPGIGSRARLAYRVESETVELVLHWPLSAAAASVGGIAVDLFPDIDASLYRWNATVLVNRGIPTGLFDETEHGSGRPLTER